MHIRHTEAQMEENSDKTKCMNFPCPPKSCILTINLTFFLNLYPQNYQAGLVIFIYTWSRDSYLEKCGQNDGMLELLNTLEMKMIQCYVSHVYNDTSTYTCHFTYCCYLLFNIEARNQVGLTG